MSLNEGDRFNFVADGRWRMGLAAPYQYEPEKIDAISNYVIDPLDRLIKNHCDLRGGSRQLHNLVKDHAKKVSGPIPLWETTVPFITATYLNNEVFSVAERRAVRAVDRFNQTNTVELRDIALTDYYLGLRAVIDPVLLLSNPKVDSDLFQRVIQNEADLSTLGRHFTDDDCRGTKLVSHAYSQIMNGNSDRPAIECLIPDFLRKGATRASNMYWVIFPYCDEVIKDDIADYEWNVFLKNLF